LANKSYNIGAIISDRQKLRDKKVVYEEKGNRAGNLFNDDGSPNTEVFDNIPHIRKAVEGNSNTFEMAQTGYGNDIDAGGINLLSQYQKTRTGVETGVDYAETGISYVFITKPDLNLTKDLKSENYTYKERTEEISNATQPALYNTLQSGFIEYVARNYPDVIDSLTCNKSGKQSFIPLLFNYYKSFSLEDQNTSEGNYNETWRGFSQKLPTTATQSYNGGTFSIMYDETNPPLITFLHKVWFDYMEGVKFNQMTPSMDTLKRREIDYSASLYYFLLAPDGETIVFWAKYTGIFPQSVPYGSFSGGDISARNLIQVTVNYVYNYKEFLEPSILVDFNDTFMNSEDIMAGFKGDITSIGNMKDFQERLIGLTDSSDYDPGSLHSDGLSTMYENKSQYIYQSKGSNLEKRAFTNVGVFKKGKHYKLLFYN